MVCTDGSNSIRGSEHDSLFVALFVEQQHIAQAARAGFDFGYRFVLSAQNSSLTFRSYFGADRFSFGSTVAKWNEIRKTAQEHSIPFIPCVSPGIFVLNGQFFSFSKIEQVMMIAVFGRGTLVPHARDLMWHRINPKKVLAERTTIGKSLNLFRFANSFLRQLVDRSAGRRTLGARRF